ncbi:hypothetical protein JQ600_09365 [Bradyrhizobium sp. AUGA SZCCT0176]|uniref:hypothetical protein n=1 Tax=unclassified Bradyrhizobium TaxID=2631580 RepID=UPI001BA82410|nr:MULTISPECIES: hypothetical protein [unclassified Bradyrhizobium]MBR1225124.1 hypothetical protein [Bradyrhizobium sp. AUGA SZCCT0176]MBR1281543.1 hypothetical protein [Bradyrhizobium sp. AUGA SZCCT0177]
MHQTVLFTSLVLMMAVAAIFLFSLSRSGAGDGSKKAPKLGALRFVLFIGALVLGAAVSIGSLRPWPRAVAAGADVVSVKVTGSQWSWEIDRKTIPVGKPVTFNIATTDVSHGFAVYDAGDQLLVQSQAMPGYINRVSYTFRTAGKYRIFCMEYCGVAHHDMTDEILVVAQ